MFEAELDSIRHLLAEVRAAVRLSATCGLQPGENEHVKNRGQEVKAVGEWCYQEGGEVWSLRGFSAVAAMQPVAVMCGGGVQGQQKMCRVRCMPSIRVPVV